MGPEAITRVVPPPEIGNDQSVGKVMDNQTNSQTSGETRDEKVTITPDWTESEWFQVWLKLARKDYQRASE